MGTSLPRNRSSGSARRRITLQINDRSELCAHGVRSRDGVRHSRDGVRHSRDGVRHSRVGVRHSRVGVRHSRVGVRHSRVGGNPVISRTPLDSRLRGNSPSVGARALR